MTFHLRNYNTNGSHQRNKSHREFSTCPCLLKSSCHKPCLKPGVWNIPFQTEYLWSDPDQTMLFASSCGHKSPVVDSFMKTINILNLDRAIPVCQTMSHYREIRIDNISSFLVCFIFNFFILFMSNSAYSSVFLNFDVLQNHSKCLFLLGVLHKATRK